MKYWLITFHASSLNGVEEQYVRKCEENPEIDDFFLNNFAPDLIDNAWYEFNYLAVDEEGAYEEFCENCSFTAEEITEEEYNKYKYELNDLSD